MTFPRLGTPRAPGPVLPARRGAGAECDAGAGSAPGGGGSGDRGSAPLLPGRDPHAAARPGRRSLAEQGEGEAARGGAEAGSGGLKARDPRTHPRGARAGWAATSGPARSAPCRSCSSRSRRCPGAEPAPPPPRAAAGTPTAPRALRPPPGAPFPPRRPPGRSRGCRASPGAWRSRGLGGVRGSGSGCLERGVKRSPRREASSCVRAAIATARGSRREGGGAQAGPRSSAGRGVRCSLHSRLPFRAVQRVAPPRLKSPRFSNLGGLTRTLAPGALVKCGFRPQRPGWRPEAPSVPRCPRPRAAGRFGERGAPSVSPLPRRRALGASRGARTTPPARPRGQLMSAAGVA